MKQLGFVSLALMIGAVFSPVHAAPPTATPSPGYEARLQESRTGLTTTFTPAPRAPKSNPKKSPRK